MSEKILSTEDKFDLAIKQHRKNNLREAEFLFEEVLKINPNHFSSAFLLGTLSAQLKNFEKAKEILSKAIKIDSNNSNAYNNLGNVLKELGELDKAVEAYEKAIKIKPENADTYVNLGIVFYNLGNINKSVDAYEKAIKINSKHIEAYNNLGNIFNDLGNYEKAINCYERAIFINPKHIIAIKNICILFRSITINNITKQNSFNLKELFLILFKRNDVDHRDISANATSVLLKNQDYEDLNNYLDLKFLLTNKIIKKLLKEELLHLVLQKSLIRNIFLEKLLTNLREEILLNFLNEKREILNENYNFIVSLSEQCFLNEYIFTQSKEEITNINKIIKSYKEDDEIDEIKIAILGCYIPLYSIKISMINYVIINLKNYYLMI